MSQIIRTTNELIINSLYLLGELGVGETPDSFMLSSGLELINELLVFIFRTCRKCPLTWSLDNLLIRFQTYYLLM